MNIFKTYTGNALLNNAIMVVLCLAKKKNIEDLTPQLLINLLEQKDLVSDNKRFKSYTMLFTRNGPLHRNSKLEETSYTALLRKIANNIEIEGAYQCSVSGLNYNKDFSQLFREMLIETHYAEAKYRIQEEKARLKNNYKEKTEKQKKKELEKILNSKDLAISRMWYPLIGSLGSDAQALPQAKFNYPIHPLCVLLLQFMPYGAVLYRKGILLFDSCNYEFCLENIDVNVKSVLDTYEYKSNDQPIKNIKFKESHKESHYILQALNIMAEQEDKEIYTDLNLWALSNSGLGASCSIRRLPNETLNNLLMFYQNGKTLTDLENLLHDSKFGKDFIENLTDKKDNEGLYPNKKWLGVGINFYDLYQNIIQNNVKLTHAKYIANLIKKAKLPIGFDKLIAKSDAYRDPNYKAVLSKVLIDEAKNGNWNIFNQLAILDDPNLLPIRNTSYEIHKMVHYYLQQKEIKSVTQPTNIQHNSKASIVLNFVVKKITEADKDYSKNFIKKDKSVGSILKKILIENCSNFEPKLILTLIYRGDQEINQSKIYNNDMSGIIELLKIYYTNPIQTDNVDANIENIPIGSFDTTGVIDFCTKYFHYYCTKYQQSEGSYPLTKFEKHVLKVLPKNNAIFYNWFETRKEIMTEKVKEKQSINVNSCGFINNLGEDKLDISLFAVELYFKKLHKTYLEENEN